MKKLLLLVLFLSVAMGGFAAWPQFNQIPNPPGANHGWDVASGTWRPFAVGANGVQKTDTVVTIGTATISVGAPPATNSQISVAAANVPISFTNLANRRKLLLINTSDTNDIRTSLDSAVASASISFGLTIPPRGSLSVDLPSTKSVSIWASATVMVDVYQEGD